MDDQELQRILAETMQDSSFGEDTEQVGSDLPSEIEVTVEDLVFTLRQIANAVIELRDKLDVQDQKLDDLQELIAEHHQTQEAHFDESMATLKQALADEQAKSQEAIMSQVKAMGSVLAEIASGTVVESRPAGMANGDDDDADKDKGAKSQEDTAKRRSDHRKLTFTARLQRKMLNEAADKQGKQASADENEPTADDAAGPTAAKADTQTPAIRRPDDKPRVPAPASARKTDETEKKTAQPEVASPDQAPVVQDAATAPQKDDDGPRNTGDVPVHPTVKQIQKQVFNFKLAVSQIVRGNELPRVGKPLHNDIAKLLTEKSNDILKKSLDLHNGNLAKAQADYVSKPASGGQEPVNFWSEDLIDSYRDFRTTWFIKQVLDKIELAVRKAGLEDHLLLLDELAMELDLGRIAVQEGTPYDAKRHQIKEGTQQPMGGDFYTILVNKLFKPGYVDLSTGKTIRKAIVSVKMVPR